MGDNNVVSIDKYSKKRAGKAVVEDWNPEKLDWKYIQLSRIAHCFFLIGVLIPFVGVAVIFIAFPILGAVLVASFVASLVLILTASRVEDWAQKKSKRPTGHPDESPDKDPPDAA